MITWTSDELHKIGKAEELRIAALGYDDTLREPVTIWVVRVADDLFVRSYRGRNGAWFRAALMRHQGQIQAGGVVKDVTFVEQADPKLNDQIDSAYQTKYGRYPEYVAPMLTAEARSTSLKLAPRPTTT